MLCCSFIQQLRVGRCYEKEQKNVSNKQQWKVCLNLSCSVHHCQKGGKIVLSIPPDSITAQYALLFYQVQHLGKMELSFQNFKLLRFTILWHFFSQAQNYIHVYEHKLFLQQTSCSISNNDVDNSDNIQLKSKGIYASHHICISSIPRQLPYHHHKKKKILPDPI